MYNVNTNLCTYINANLCTYINDFPHRRVLANNKQCNVSTLIDNLLEIGFKEIILQYV